MPTENKPVDPSFDLNTPDGGRGYIDNLFKTVLKRHDYRQYISERLAGDFACTLAQHLEGVKAHEQALQLRLNVADQRIDDFAGGECEWHREDDSGIWNSGCGETWSFHDDGPAENGMHFCHSCGKALVVTADEQEPAVDYGPTPGCKQCEEAERCGFTDCPECDAQLCNDVNGNGFQPGREPA